MVDVALGRADANTCVNDPSRMHGCRVQMFRSPVALLARNCRAATETETSRTVRHRTLMRTKDRSIFHKHQKSIIPTSPESRRLFELGHSRRRRSWRQIRIRGDSLSGNKRNALNFSETVSHCTGNSTLTNAPVVQEPSTNNPPSSATLISRVRQPARSHPGAENQRSIERKSRMSPRHRRARPASRDRA